MDEYVERHRVQQSGARSARAAQFLPLCDPCAVRKLSLPRTCHDGKAVSIVDGTGVRSGYGRLRRPTAGHMLAGRSKEIGGLGLTDQTLHSLPEILKTSGLARSSARGFGAPVP